MGRCGKCRVRFLSGAPTPTAADMKFFSEKELSEGTRLLCRAVLQGDCEIELYGAGDGMVIEETDSGDPSDSFGKRDPGRTFAIAIDLGTTTIAAALVEKSVDECAVTRTRSCVNRQRKYGSDVISRISAAEDGAALEDMARLVTEDMENLIWELIHPEMQDGELIGELSYITVAGNTTMMNLFGRRDVSWLGTYPYADPGSGLGLEQMIADKAF